MFAKKMYNCDFCFFRLRYIARTSIFKSISILNIIYRRISSKFFHSAANGRVKVRPYWAARTRGLFWETQRPIWTQAKGVWSGEVLRNQTSERLSAVVRKKQRSTKLNANII